MGLPMWKDPEEIENIRTGTKPRYPVAHARSAIHRQRTVRHIARGQPLVSYLSASRRSNSNHRFLRIPHDQRRHYTSTMNEIPDLESPLRNSDHVQAADTVRIEDAQHNQTESGRTLLPDVPTYERPTEPLSVRRPAVPVTAPDNPDSDLAANEPSARSEYYMNSSQTSGGLLESGDTQRNETLPGTALLTPGFAPARWLSRDANGNTINEFHELSTRSEALALLSRRLPMLHQSLREQQDCEFVGSLMDEVEQMRVHNPRSLTTNYLAEEASYLRQIGERLHLLATNVGETRLSDINGSSLLRRITRSDNTQEGQSQRLSRRRGQVHLDGLGHRQRSANPDDDAWDTMLTSIPPDERVPSSRFAFGSTPASYSSIASERLHSSSATLTPVATNSAEVEICPAPNNVAEAGILRPLNVDENDAPAPSTLNLPQVSDNHLSHLESMSQFHDTHSTYDDHHARFRRLVEREQELQYLEGSLQLLERHVTGGRTTVATPPGQVPEDMR